MNPEDQLVLKSIIVSEARGYDLTPEELARVVELCGTNEKPMSLSIYMIFHVHQLNACLAQLSSKGLMLGLCLIIPIIVVYVRYGPDRLPPDPWKAALELRLDYEAN